MAGCPQKLCRRDWAGAALRDWRWGRHELGRRGPGGEREGWGECELERGNGRQWEGKREMRKKERKRAKKNKSVLIDGCTEWTLINEQAT